MAITRTSIVDDDGTGTTGTVLDNAWKQEFYDQIDAIVTPLSAGSSVITTTGNITALTLPTGTGPLVVYMNNASLATIQGISAGVHDQQLTIFSTNAQVDLSHQDAAATAARRLINFATSGKTSLAAGVGTATLIYDATATRWRLMRHEQGAFIVPTYAGGNFTANGSMTWTVDSGDVTTMAYYLRGRQLEVVWSLGTTTVGGTVNSVLQITNAAWGSFTAARAMPGSMSYVDNGAAQVVGITQVLAGGTLIQNLKSAIGNWTLSTNNTTVTGTITFEVQ